MSKTKDNPVRLRAYLAVGDKGQPVLHVCTEALNPLGDRCQKGTPFPRTIKDFVQGPEWETAVRALQDLQGHFDQQAEKGRR